MRWRALTQPGPVPNALGLCKHGNLPEVLSEMAVPRLFKYVSLVAVCAAFLFCFVSVFRFVRLDINARLRAVTQQAWEYLVGRYGGGPQLPAGSLHPCAVCVVRCFTLLQNTHIRTYMQHTNARTRTHVYLFVFRFGWRVLTLCCFVVCRRSERRCSSAARKRHR